MAENEVERDIPCLVCFNLRIPIYPDLFETQRKLARKLAGRDPFDEGRRLFVEVKSLDATAAAGCLPCLLLKSVWGRLGHTEQLCSGRGDMGGRRGFLLYSDTEDLYDPSEYHVLFLGLKDRDYVIHTMEGESCPWDGLITSLSWSSFLPTLDQVRLFVQNRFDERLLSRRGTHTEESGRLSVLPTRLLMLNDGRPPGDIETGLPLDIRLIQTSSIAQNFEDDARYVALSHCWGSPGVAARMIQTTTKTIGKFSQSIPWGGLTKTFQDAMLVTKHLGIRYIWIDSLCIVQDDAQDWAGEASRMATVYANASLTIAATGATDGDQGLFINRGNEPVLRPGVHEIKLPGLQYPIYVRGLESYHDRALRNPLNRLTEMPLLHRGWAFQERMLSPLMLHFTKNELIFEAYEGGISCECKELKYRIEDAFIRRHVLLGTGTLLPRYWSWYGIVEKYASSLLTSEADRLPALSGVATTFQRQMPALGSYLAGLWEADIVSGLQWFVNGTVQPRLQPTLARETLLSAPPTWSWASVGSSNISWYGHNTNHLVEIISATCFPLTSDDKGMVAGGRITLRGLVCLATLVDLSPHSSTAHARRYSFSLVGESMAHYAPASFSPDVELCSTDGVFPAVYFLPLSIHQKRHIHDEYFLQGLVLCRETKEISSTNQVEHSMKETAAFSRVGCAIVTIETEERDSLFKGDYCLARYRLAWPRQMFEEQGTQGWFAKWRNTSFDKLGQAQVLTIV